MNTESIDCHKVEFGKMQKPGDFCFDDEFRTLYVWLPGQSGPDCVPIKSGEWRWDGDQDHPTVSPSIHVVGQWHGWLHAGRLVSC
jgi:hypothetical protein